MDDIERDALIRRIQQLEAENAKLKKEVAFLRTHPTISQGIRGELLIATLADGQLTGYAVGHDIETATGVLVEVKFSKLNSPVTGGSTRRWNWSKPLGSMDKGKEYDFLLLIGEADERFPEQYEEGVPYVFFLVPYGDVGSVMIKGRTIGGQIGLTSNIMKLAQKREPPPLLQYHATYNSLRSLIEPTVSGQLSWPMNLQGR